MPPAADVPAGAPLPGSNLQQAAMGAILAALVVMGLYFGRPVLVPIALSVLLAFALGPVVGLLRRLWLGRVLSVLLSVVFAVAVIGLLGTFIGGQFAGLAAALPQYQTNVVNKIQSIQGQAAHSSFVQKTSNVVKNITHQITGDQNSPAAQLARRASSGKPIPVVIEDAATDAPIAIAETLIGPLLEPLATLAIVIVFVIFILLQKDDLRDRFIRLAGSRDLTRTSVAMDEAAERLSRYLLLQTTVNTIFGTVIAFSLWMIGVPNPFLWGLMAGLFRYVPYVGVPLAALFPIVLSVAVDPGWAMTVQALVLFSVAELITGQFIEPFLYGRHMGLSAIAVVMAAAFWTWVWGPVGLLLSTPLTMCLVVIGRHAPPLAFLDILLGDSPALAQEESFYLRMLEGDPDEAANQADAYLSDHTLEQYYDSVAIRALVMAQHDAERGLLDHATRVNIKTTIEGLAENLSDHTDHDRKGEEIEHSEAAVSVSWQGEPVLCVAGRGSLDEAAGALLMSLLHHRGIGARLVTAEEASPQNIHALKVDGVRMFCVSYLEPGNYQAARYLVRRLKKRLPGAIPMAGYWGMHHNDTDYLNAIEATECDLVMMTLSEAVERIVAMARDGGPPQPAVHARHGKHGEPHPNPQAPKSPIAV
ncbi:MAG TPA: AI-2E family transporter [Rhizomicrobium sp.]|nr:AI-2E family transporter [Rhizomicrobium sp.]